MKKGGNMKIAPVQTKLNYNCNKNVSRPNFLGADLKVKGPSLINGYNGEIKGVFNEVPVDFKIDEKIFTFFNRKKLTGTYNIDNQSKNCNLKFREKLNLAYKYKIKGDFGDKNVDLDLTSPIIKYGSIEGQYNSKELYLEINKKVSNIFRNDYQLTGTMNGKNVDLRCKGLLFFDGNMEGTFDGVPIKFTTDQKLNPFVDTRAIKGDFELNGDDNEDLLFLKSIITINDLFLRQ